MEKEVFYIEKEKMLRSMFEIAFKNKKQGIYTIDSIVSNYYLLDDLKPKIIIFDVKTVGPELDKLLAYSTQAILVATGDKEDQNVLGANFKNFILKPISAHNLVKTILDFAHTI